jgi:hypothetical protein
MSVQRDLMNNQAGSVSVWTAAATPLVVMALAMGTEVSTWSVVKVDLQRNADYAALAGAISFSTGQTDQAAATAAADVARMNGASGTNTPTWEPTTKLLTSGDITVKAVPGLAQSNNTAFEVNIKRDLQPGLTRIFAGGGTVTVAANGHAELVPMTVTKGGGGGQPCIFGMDGIQDAVLTRDAVQFAGNSSAQLIGCTVRSNGDITAGNSVTITADAYYASGGFDIQSGAVIGPRYPNVGQIGDPYLTHTELQTALNNAASAVASGALDCQAKSCSGPAGSFSCVAKSCTINPGVYTEIRLSSQANVTASPGVYVVTNTIDLAGGSSLWGTNVTFLVGSQISGGTDVLTANGGSEVNLTASTVENAPNGTLPGIAFASRASGDMRFLGNSSLPFIGVVYMPNGTLKLTGAAVVGSSLNPGCAQLVANVVELGGNGSFVANGCPAYGTKNFDSLPSIVSTTLVPVLLK